MKRWGNVAFYAVILVLWCFISWIEGHGATVRPASLWLDGLLVGHYTYRVVDLIFERVKAAEDANG